MAQFELTQKSALLEEAEEASIVLPRSIQVLAGGVTVAAHVEEQRRRGAAGVVHLERVAGERGRFVGYLDLLDRGSKRVAASSKRSRCV
jgi:hypothetical protein